MAASLHIRQHGNWSAPSNGLAAMLPDSSSFAIRNNLQAVIGWIGFQVVFRRNE
jgi:hypothetical protein